MTITYEWKIDSVKVKDQVNQDGDSLTDVVCQIKWAKHGVDEDGNRGIFGGVDTFSAYEVGLPDFTSFADLTEDLVVQWVQQKVVGSYAEHVDAKIAKKLELNGVKNKHVPWEPTLAAGIPEPASEESDP